jgi:lipopolysaccharide transport system ATP-binding protein
MSNVALRVSNLGKCYRIGQRESYKTLRDAISNVVSSPFRSVTHLFHPNNVTDRINYFWALKNVNFSLEQGEVLGIIGGNGAGKSTLLKILSRITTPTEGFVELHGRLGSLLEVGTGFHPELTGRENIFLSGSILGMKKWEIEGKFDEIVNFSEIEKFLDTPVKRYSSGMYMRLAFAVAAHLEPEILLVDEVLAVGDAAFQKKCLEKMGDVAKEGRTVLFVSHNLSAIRRLCTRAILLDHGTLIADGVAEDVVNIYIGHLKENINSHEWSDNRNAPQNSTAIIKRVSLCDDYGKQINEIYTDTEFNIEIKFEVKEIGDVGFTISFWDKENNCIFATMNNHEANFYGKSMCKGTYESKCKIPANFFNNGLFNVTIYMFGKGYSDGYTVRDVLRLEVLDGPTVRKDYFGGYPGVIRPLFDWVTVKLEDSKSACAL